MVIRRVLGIVLAGVAMLVFLPAAVLYTPDKDRAALEAEYAPPPSEFLAVAGLRLHVRDTGPRDAPAIVMLHGFGGSLHTWEEWAREFDPTFRVVRFDLPGFGLTGPDPSGDYSDARAVAVVSALMDRLGIARADVIGHSMGGRIAWVFAATRPERVSKLVLVSPDGFASPGMAYGVAQKVPLLLRVLPYVLPTPLLRASLLPAYKNPATMTDALLARYRDMLLAPGVRKAIVDRAGQTVLTDPEPLLRRIAAPTLLLWGESDAMIPFANSADYLRNLSHARLEALPGVGHIPMEEAPAASARVVREFLTR